MARAKSKTAARPRAGRSSSRRSTESAEPRPRWLSRSLWLLAASAWVYLTLALLWFTPGDAPSHAASQPADPPLNITGIVGSTAAYWLLVSLGSGTWALLAFAAAALVTLVKGDRIDHPIVRCCGAVLVTLAIGGLHAQWMPEAGSLPGAKGGLVPLWIVDELLPRFGAAGTSIALLLLLLVGAVVAAERLVSLSGRLVVRGFRSLESLRGVRIPIPRLPWARRVAIAGGGAEEDDGESSRNRRARRWQPVAEEDEEDEAEYEEEEEGRGR